MKKTVQDFRQELRQKFTQKDFWIRAAIAAVLFLVLPGLCLCVAKEFVLLWMLIGDTIALIVVGLLVGIRMKDEKFLFVLFASMYVLGVFLFCIAPSCFEYLQNNAGYYYGHYVLRAVFYDVLLGPIEVMALHIAILSFSMHEGKRLRLGLWRESLKKLVQKFIQTFTRVESWIWIGIGAIVFLVVPIILLCAKEDTFPWMFYGDTIAFIVLGVISGIRLKNINFLPIAFYLLYAAGIGLARVNTDWWEFVDSLVVAMLMVLHFLILLFSVYEGKRFSGGLWKKYLEKFRKMCTQKEFCSGMVIGAIVFFVVPGVLLYAKADMITWTLCGDTIALIVLGFIAGIRAEDRWIRCGVFYAMYVVGQGLFLIIPLVLGTVHTEYVMLAVLGVFALGGMIGIQFVFVLVGFETGSFISFCVRKIIAARTAKKER